MPALSLGLEDDGGRFPIGVGTTVSVRLPETPSTGFRWEVESVDPTLLQPLGSDFELTRPATFGSGGIRRFAFQALAPGVVEFSLRHWQSWEGPSSVTRRFRVTLEIGDDPFIDP
jgi:inhibitor of cysteine peptidase